MSEDRSGQMRLTRRRFIGASAALSGAVVLGGGTALAGCGGGDDSSSGEAAVAPEVDGKELVLLTWKDFFDADAIKGFEQEHGVTVKQTFLIGGDQLSKLASKQPYDCAIALHVDMPSIVEANLVRELDHAKFTYWSQVLPAFQNPPYDPGARHTAPYALAPAGLAFQTKRVAQEDLTGSWSDVWTLAPKLDHHAYVMNDMQTSIGMALAHLGFDENSDVASEVEQAGDALVELLPQTGGLSNPSIFELMTSGRGWLVPGFSNDAYYSLVTVDDPSSIGFQFCREGALTGMTPMVVPTAAKSPGLGALFIDWMLKPENMAANVKAIGAAVPTKAGMQAYDETVVKQFPFLKLDDAMLNEFKGWQTALTAARRKLYNAQWARVQAAS